MPVNNDIDIYCNYRKSKVNNRVKKMTIWAYFKTSQTVSDTEPTTAITVFIDASVNCILQADIVE